MTAPLSRRAALLVPLGAPLAAPAKAAPLAGCQTNAWPITAGDFPQLLAVLERIRALGYQGFETSFRNLQARFGQPGPAREAIRKTGLRFLGIHIFLLSYDPETAVAPWELIRSVADGGAALGAERLILSGRALGGDARPDAAALERKAAALRRAGEYCAGKGMKLCYHNHHLEFTGGSNEIEELLRRAGPLLTLALDAGHAAAGGADAARFFARHAARIQVMHLRDFRQGKQVPLGRGEFDLKALARAVRSAGWSGWLVNEEERPDDVRPGDSVVEPARQCLRDVFGV